MTTTVNFTQYLRPNGAKVPVSIEVSDELGPKVDAIYEAGFHFECEVLTDDTTCSFTIGDDHGDYANELCTNGETVPTHVEKMIKNFDITLAKRRSTEIGGV